METCCKRVNQPYKHTRPGRFSIFAGPPESLDWTRSYMCPVSVLTTRRRIRQCALRVRRTSRASRRAPRVAPTNGVPRMNVASRASRRAAEALFMNVAVYSEPTAGAMMSNRYATAVNKIW
jgi:hypothetical protein